MTLRAPRADGPHQVEIVLYEVFLEPFNGKRSLAHALDEFMMSESLPCPLNIRPVKDILQEPSTKFYLGKQVNNKDKQ